MENHELKNNELFAELAKYQKDSKEYRALVAKIVESNVGLIRYVASRYFVSRKNPTINDDDLISEGYLGMLKAIESFDPAKGFPTSYLRQYIEGYVRNYLNRQRKRECPSLEDDIPSEYGDEKLGDVVASPINVEEDFVEKVEKKRQVNLLKRRVDRLTKKQRDFLTAKYLSGNRLLSDDELADKFECSRQNVALVSKKGLANLRRMYGVEVNTPPEVSLTKAEKIKIKAMLKDLILTELPPSQKKTMLCKYYSGTPKTDAEVAQELEGKESCVWVNVSLACKKLCTVCDSVNNTKHLKSILGIDPEKTAKEC